MLSTGCAGPRVMELQNRETKVTRSGEFHSLRLRPVARYGSSQRAPRAWCQSWVPELVPGSRKPDVQKQRRRLPAMAGTKGPCRRVATSALRIASMDSISTIEMQGMHHPRCLDNYAWNVEARKLCC